MQRGHLILSLGALIGVGVAAFVARGGFDGEGVRYFLGALLGGLKAFAMGDAPTNLPGDSPLKGRVQIMTMHKAKGLE